MAFCVGVLFLDLNPLVTSKASKEWDLPLRVRDMINGIVAFGGVETSETDGLENNKKFTFL